MLVVGAHILETYWTRAPSAEAPLRALHALLSRAAPSDRMLAGMKDGRVALEAGETVVSLRINAAAQVAAIEKVETKG